MTSSREETIADLLRRIAELARDPAASERWSRDALGEHASVASFARFSLGLLAVGAPPSLVAETHRAALDEIDHARLSFAIASRFAGEPLGPGPLSMEGDILGALDLASLVRAAAHEGCIGEARAAEEARAARDRENDPTLRDVLSLIAEDETRHAELAWSFVRWAMEHGGDEIRIAFEDAMKGTER